MKIPNPLLANYSPGRLETTSLPFSTKSKHASLNATVWAIQTRLLQRFSTCADVSCFGIAKTRADSRKTERPPNSEAPVLHGLPNVPDIGGLGLQTRDSLQPKIQQLGARSREGMSQGSPKRKPQRIIPSFTAEHQQEKQPSWAMTKNGPKRGNRRLKGRSALGRVTGFARRLGDVQVCLRRVGGILPAFSQASQYEHCCETGVMCKKR